MKRVALLLHMLAAFLVSSFGDAGVLLPRDKQQPDPAVLSLEEMEIKVRIDNGDAHVYVRQVFVNHTSRIEEGTYIFALPSRATVSDFAVWDGPVRIPAVILERKRAEEIYTQLKLQSIDPGLLQMGERGAEEARRSAVFSAKIVPIMPYGTKRMELEYHESIPVENFKSYFSVPLRPDAYHAQVAEHFWIDFELVSAQPVTGFKVGGTLYPLSITEQSGQKNGHVMKGRIELHHVNLSEDFSVQYGLDPNHADTLNILTYRNPEPGQPNPTETAPEISKNAPGFFEAEALLGEKKVAGPTKEAGRPRTVVVLFDTSLSMQWEKLERSYAALDKLLRGLRPEDKFNLLLFNSKIEPLQPAVVPADAANVSKAIAFVRESRLRGGTDVQAALQAGLAQCAAAGGSNSYLVLLSDGGATRGPVHSGKLAAWYESKRTEIPAPQRPRTFVFAVGDDANLPLVRMLTRNEGVLENVLSTEPYDFKLDSFLSKIGRSPVSKLGLAASPAASVQMVYPLQDAAFAGSIASWVGQYDKPRTKLNLTVSGVREGEPLNLHATTVLPVAASDHPQLPRLWARARVDALLEKIERDGEDRATIDEIIRLSRKYKFVTPYTSFLAAPRSLLRPRVIRPGDPVLRVRTDPSITSVVALFPFGLTKPLRHLQEEDIWQTRFLAPDDMQDGTYNVRLILRDRQGNTYRESKSFIIASKSPAVQILLERKQYRRGETIHLKVNATATTRTLTARMEGAEAASLRWDPHAGANTGQIIVPGELPAGLYRLTVIAEDVAHNIGTQEVQIEILP